MMRDMVELVVRLVAAPGRVQDVLHALRVTMRPALRVRGCRFAQIYRWADDDRRLTYVEEWDDPGALREQFGSERFVRLLELLDAAAERPIVEFRVISEQHGLEYMTAEPDSEGAVH